MGGANSDLMNRRIERLLWLACVLACSVLLVEIIGGMLAHSLALLAHAAHTFATVAILAIALAALRPGRGRGGAGRHRSVAYHRFTVLAAAFNAMLLFTVAWFILYEAYRRIAAPPQVDAAVMLGIAVLGLLLNVVSMQLLRTGKDGERDLKAVSRAPARDLLGIGGLIAGAIVILFTAWTWVDILLATVLALTVVPRSWLLLQATVNALIAGVPEEIDVETLRECLLAMPGIKGVHDLRAWASASGKICLTVHVVHSPEQPAMLVQTGIRRMLAGQFAITDATVQCELSPCDQTDQVQQFSRRSADGRPHQRHAGHGH